MWGFFTKKKTEVTDSSTVESTSTALDLTAESKASSSYKRRLSEIEEQVNAIPEDATVGGGTYIIRNNKRLFVAFKNKAHMLRILGEAKSGEIEILLG